MHRSLPLAAFVALAFAGPAHAAVQIATVDTPGSVHDLALDGTIGYAADGLSGIRVLDFSNPAAPVEIASLPPIALGNVAALSLDGDRLYAAEGVGGISIVDVANPASPVRLGSVSGFDTTADILASGDYAYVLSAVGPLGFYVVDVSDPANPVQVAALDAPGSTLTRLSPNRIVVGGSRLIDVSDPLNPFIVEEGTFFTDGVGDGFGIGSEIARYDLSDPEHAVLVNQWLLPTSEAFYSGVAVSAELAWASGANAGLAVFDVTDAEPSHPLVSSIDFPGFTTVKRVRLVGTRLYVAAVGVGRGLYVYDASNPAALTQLGYLAGDVWDLDVAGNLAFYTDPSASNDPAGLYVVDVSNPAAMTAVGFVPYSFPEMVSVSGNRAYVVDTHGVQDVLLAFDVSNPAAPVQIGSLGSLGAVRSLASTGNLVLLTTTGGINGRLRVLDATAPAAIAQIGEYTTTGQPSASGLAVVGPLAYVTSESVEVVNFSIPYSPIRVASFDQASTSFAQPVPVGSRLYVNATGGSVLTLDLSDLIAPRVIGASVLRERNGSIVTGASAGTSAALFFGTAIGTSAWLRAFDTSQPSGLGPRRLASFPTITGTSLQLDPARDLAFVLDGVVRVVDIAADRLLYECANGLDDDGDLLVDHALDPGCRDGHDPSETADCGDGVDDDGDGLTDFPADPSCASAAEASEAPSCDDGTDDDGDGFVDFGADPGCSGWLSEIENAKCQNGLDDDGDGKIDFDGGASLNGGIPIAPADSNCPYGSRNSEAPSHCGLGAELALALFAGRLARRRVLRAPARPGVRRS